MPSREAREKRLVNLENAFNGALIKCLCLCIWQTLLSKATSQMLECMKCENPSLIEVGVEFAVS